MELSSRIQGGHKENDLVRLEHQVSCADQSCGLRCCCEARIEIKPAQPDEQVEAHDDRCQAAEEVILLEDPGIDRPDEQCAAPL